MRSANPGQPRNSVFNRRLANELLKTEPQGMDVKSIPMYSAGQEIIVKVMLDPSSSLSSISPHDPVTLGDTWFPDNVVHNNLLDPLVTGFSLINPPPSTPGQRTTMPDWGIALDFISKTKPGRVLLFGVTWLNVKSSYDLNYEPLGECLDIVNGNIRRVMYGRCKPFSYKPSSPKALVIIGHHQHHTMYYGKVTGGIPLNTAKAVNIYLPDPDQPDGMIDSGRTINCRTWPTPITNSPATVEIKYMYGGYYAMEIC